MLVALKKNLFFQVALNEFAKKTTLRVVGKLRGRAGHYADLTLPFKKINDDGLPEWQDKDGNCCLNTAHFTDKYLPMSSEPAAWLRPATDKGNQTWWLHLKGSNEVFQNTQKTIIPTATGWITENSRTPAKFHITFQVDGGWTRQPPTQNKPEQSTRGMANTELATLAGTGVSTKISSDEDDMEIKEDDVIVLEAGAEGKRMSVAVPIRTSKTAHGEWVG